MINGLSFDILLESMADLRNIDSIAYDVVSNNAFKEDASVMVCNGYDDVMGTYMKKIDESFTVLSSVTVDPSKITDFFTKVREYPSFKNSTSKIIYMKGIYDNEVFSIKPMYLVQYVSNAAKIIDSIVKGKSDENDVSSYFSPDMMVRMKRQSVHTKIDPQEELKSYVYDNKGTAYAVTDSFLVKTILPFLQNFDSNKKEIASEISETRNSFKVCSEKMQSYNEVLQKMVSEKRLDDDTIKTLNFFLYNFNRAVSQFLSYVSFMLVRKIDDNIYNIKQLTKLYGEMYEHFESSIPVVHENAMDGELYDTEKAALTDQMLQGDASTLSAICNNLYRKTRTDYANMSSERDVLDRMDIETDNILDHEVYDDIQEVLTSINTAIDSFARNLQDENNTIEDIADKCGLEGMNDRFSLIVSKIPMSGVPRTFDSERDNRYSLFGLMNELNHGSDSCQMIADKISEVSKHFKDVRADIQENYDNKYPNECLNKEAINYINSSIDQFSSIVRSISDSLAQRFHNIGNACVVLMKPDEIRIESGELEPFLIDNIDYIEMAYESILESEEDLTKDIFEEKMESHARRKMMYDLQYVGMFEADDSNKEQSVEVQDNSANSTNAQDQNNKAADMVNNDAEGTTSGDPNTETSKFNFNEFKEKLAAFFEKMIKKFTDTINKAVPINQKFFNRSKAALLARSYDNVSLKMANYSALKENIYMTDIAKLKNNVASLTADQLRSGNKEEITKHLLAFVPGIENVENKSVGLTNYYKTGKVSEKEIPITEFKNVQLRDEVNKMITFCEGFYNGEFQQVADQLTEVKNSLESKIQEVSSDTSENASAKTGCTTASSVVKLYSAALLNCYRDRANDNIRALRKLVPKKGKNAPAEEPAPEENTEPVEGNAENTEGNNGENTETT